METPALVDGTEEVTAADDMADQRRGAKAAATRGGREKAAPVTAGGSAAPAMAGCDGVADSHLPNSLGKCELSLIHCLF